MEDVKPASRQELIEDLKGLVGERARRSFLKRYSEAIDTALVEQLCDEVTHLIWVDGEQANELAETVRFLADALDDDYCRARSARACANVYHITGESERAQELYDSALEGFTRLGDESEAAITRSSALVNLGYLGEYELVREWEEAARGVFERLSDRLRLAILEHNFATILFRQDRWEKALSRYDFAHQEFVKLGRPQDASICLRNMAACHINLYHFSEALEVYEKTRDYCEKHGLQRLVLEVDYNVACLHYMRGEYTRAIHLFREARRGCELGDDEVHKAHCDLDQAEMFLELNLVDEAATLAESALADFDRLRRPYESAKALTASAIALSRQGKGSLALERLQKAREIFEAEQNPIWLAQIDFYQAVVLYREQRPVEAVSLARSARETFSSWSIASKAAMCELLLAELDLDLEEPEKARTWCYDALARLEGLGLPVLEHRAHMVLGQVEEALGDRQTAIEAYQESHRLLEKLRSQLQDEEIKIAFLGDKGMIYESLVWLTMQDRAVANRSERSFLYMEQARSRSLADMMAFRAHALPGTARAQDDLADQVRALREELNWFYRQIDVLQMRGGERSLSEVQKLREDIRSKEDQLLRRLRQLQATDQEFSSLQSGIVIDLKTIRSSLSEDTLLVEYFIARGTVFGCVLSLEALEIFPLTSVRRTQAIHRRLQFQLSRSALGAEILEGSQSLIEEATRAHLGDLYAELIAPIRRHLNRPHLAIVPHGFLHYVPFHALYDGEKHLIDEFSISYAPSASVFHLCTTKENAYDDKSLVLGVADERAPLIVEEVQAVAESLPEVTLLIDEDANEEALQRLGANSRFIHIASHGLFRRDNPMFSAIQMGSSRLSLFDLYNLRLSAELVVLSGCGTGLNAVLGADELVGLTRGLFYAGAQSVLVSLWDVNDASTALFMRRFYDHLGRGTQRADALRRTMLDVRERYPSPYNWAPFVLVGKPFSSRPPPPVGD